MRGLVTGLLTLALAGCATAGGGPGRPNPGWLLGTWLLIEPDLEFPFACASGLPIRYEPGGRYVLFEESGSWRLEGDRLTETALLAHDTADPADVEIGRPFVSRIVRTGPDSFRKIYADGEDETFRRCPDSR